MNSDDKEFLIYFPIGEHSFRVNRLFKRGVPEAGYPKGNLFTRKPRTNVLLYLNKKQGALKAPCRVVEPMLFMT